MRIVSFNVNGLRTLRGYQPWYNLKDFEACLDFLQGDIVCFQETKMTRKQLDRSLAMVPSFHAFFNFHPTKGYSGTAVYVRKTVSIPLRAECGITGEWRPPKAVGTGSDGSVIGAVPKDAKDELDAQLWRNLDLEGRAVVIDCGMFVLFNLYSPNLTGPERAEYKQAFNRVVGERANRLLDEGREVIIIGDLNICYQPIDHADPEQSLKDYGITDFGDTPGRRWLKTMIDPAAGGRFIDAARHFHPTRTRMYTCWNQKIDARPANYGTRIDYTLVSRGLLGWLKDADIQADIYGSDHCPVYVELHDEREIEGRKVKLRDLMHGWDPDKEPAGPSRGPPPLATCNEEEFSEKRRSIASFFTASGPKVAPKATVAKQAPATKSSDAAGPAPTPLAATQDLQIGTDTGEPSVADAFSALRSVDNSAASAPIQDTAADAEASQNRLEDRPSQPLATANTVRGADTSSSRTPVSPGTSELIKAKGVQRKTSATKGKVTSKGSDDRQQTLAGFFKRPSQPSVDVRDQMKDDASRNQATTPQASPSRSTSSQTLEVPHSTASSEAPALQTAEDHDDSAAKRVGTALAWGSIFTAPPAPKCSLHGETAKSWTVNKPGKNHGRKFWLCARPVGPGYEKSGRDRQDVNPEYRCDYFAWDSDVRAGWSSAGGQSAALEGADPTALAGPHSSPPKSSQKRAAPAATLSDVSLARQRREASQVTSPHKRARGSQPSPTARNATRGPT